MATDFDKNMKWSSDLRLKAESWNYPYNLFPEIEPIKLEGMYLDLDKPKSYAVSDNEQWIWVNRIIPGKESLNTYYGARKGKVVFTDDVVCSAIWEKSRRLDVWMSFTPMEVFTLRGGTRLAKGHTVIAGLGMGYQLIEVCQRSQVKEITLIERSETLVNFLYERILKFCNSKKINLIIGDAYKELPKLDADIALIDIFPNYGGNNYELNKIKRVCEGIKSWWGWGTSELYESSSYMYPSFLCGFPRHSSKLDLEEMS